jgi:hypothetical protein
MQVELGLHRDADEIGRRDLVVIHATRPARPRACDTRP